MEAGRERGSQQGHTFERHQKIRGIPAGICSAESVLLTEHLAVRIPVRIRDLLSYRLSGSGIRAVRLGMLFLHSSKTRNPQLDKDLLQSFRALLVEVSPQDRACKNLCEKLSQSSVPSCFP